MNKNIFLIFTTLTTLGLNLSATAHNNVVVVPLGGDTVEAPWTGPWISGHDYKAGELTEFNGASYIAKINHTSAASNVPPDIEWDLIAAKGSKGAKGNTGDQGEDGDSFFSTSTAGIKYHNIEFDDSNSSGRINLTSSSHVYQLSPEGATLTVRDDNTYKFGYYGPDEFGPTSNNTLSLGSSTYRWKEVWSNNPLNTTSDRRLKKNIVTSEYGLDAVMQLNPVKYQWKEGHQVPMLGFIAQEVEQIIPTVVKHDTVSPVRASKMERAGRTLSAVDFDTYSLSYSQLIPVLTKALQELATENLLLSARIDSLESSQ